MILIPADSVKLITGLALASLIESLRERVQAVEAIHSIPTYAVVNSSSLDTIGLVDNSKIAMESYDVKSADDRKERQLQDDVRLCSLQLNKVKAVWRNIIVAAEDSAQDGEESFSPLVDDCISLY